ncbi:hypothetical protein PMI32_01429 [Pseudomonas sp. GM60]|nr:hypothetical protein PMI32_01429 [Pseudomonas sp. GM60]
MLSQSRKSVKAGLYMKSLMIQGALLFRIFIGTFSWIFSVLTRTLLKNPRRQHHFLSQKVLRLFVGFQAIGLN